MFPVDYFVFVFSKMVGRSVQIYFNVNGIYVCSMCNNCLKLCIKASLIPIIFDQICPFSLFLTKHVIKMTAAVNFLYYTSINETCTSHAPMFFKNLYSKYIHKYELDEFNIDVLNSNYLAVRNFMMKNKKKYYLAGVTNISSKLFNHSSSISHKLS